MITRHTRGKVTWIDIESPSREELQEIMNEFSIDTRIEEEMITPTPYPIHITFDDYIYLVLHFPTTDPAGGAKSQEIDFIIGKEFIITSRYELIDSIHTLHKVFEAEEMLGLSHHSASETTATLLERLIRRLYGAIREEVEMTVRSLDRIERDIFSGKEREMVRAISEIGRVLLRFDTTLLRHAEPLESFLRDLSTPEFFGKRFQTHATHIEAERDHAAALVASYRAVASELRNTNESLLSASQNEVMKTLTVITFTILPMTLIAALFQMNVSDIPLSDNPHGFWIVICIIAVISGLMILFSRFKRWL